MRNTISALACTLLTLLATVTSCSDDKPSGSNKYVTTFTAGTVSRYAKAYLLLADSIPQDVAGEIDLDDVLSISPSVDGQFTLANNSTIVFSPSESFARGETYTVKAKIGKLFSDAESPDKTFVFQFSTMPLAFSGSFAGLQPSADGRTYSMEFHIRSLDREDSLTVMKSIRASEGEPTWEEDGDGYGRTLRIEAKEEEKSRELEIYSLNDSIIATATVPGANDIDVYGIAYKKEDGQSFVEISFTKQLDPKQKMEGLAYVEDCQNTKVTITGNVLRLYPDRKLKRATVFISGAIRSAKGVALGEDTKRDVTLETGLPEVRFTTDGVIVPQSDKVAIPFRSIGMRGVRVRVFKVFKDNIGSLLQESDLDSYGVLARYGRPVAVKTIDLERDGIDLMSWHTFAIDLSDIMKAERGTLYRIELEMDKGLSAWPVADATPLDKEAIAKKDALVFNQLIDKFNSGDTWYYPNYYYWNWDELDDPSKSEYYDSRPIEGRNVLATNIGLTAITNGDGRMRIVALDLTDASPMAGVTISAYSQQKQLLQTVTTGSDGIADIEYDRRIGVPGYIAGAQGDDVSYLRVANGKELSTSTFDVSGEVVQSGIKCFIYGDRGVWRPGDTIHLTAMIQSQGDEMPSNHPVELELRTPQGTTLVDKVSTQGVNGIYTFDIPTESTAATGVYTAKVTVGSATFSKNVRVETIKPNRLKIDLKLPKTVSSRGGAKADLHTEWLTGAKAHDMRYTLTATMVPAKTSFAKFPKFVFDSPERQQFIIRDESIANGTTDGDGNAAVNFNPQTGKNAPGMLSASITTKVIEPSGEFSIDVSRCQYSPYSRYAGIKTPQEGERQLDCGRTYKFAVASVDENGTPQAGVRLSVNVYKVEYWWWWSASGDDMANYTANEWNRPVATKQVKTGDGGKAEFDLNIARNDWGTYLIKVSDDESGHTTGTLAYFDWPEMENRGVDGEANAMALKVLTDKDEYAAGETMRVSFPSATGAKAIVNICRGSRILSSRIVDCGASKTSVGIDVTDEMAPNVYAIVSLVQPYANTKNDNPIRLYGVAQASVSSAASHLTPQISAKEEVRPMQPMSVSVSEKDGRAMAYTIAVVDEGLLDLTRFKTPDPWSAFNAREALGLKMWDVYNDVAGAYGGRIESMFSIGGDDALNGGPKAVVNRFTPMTYFAGPFSIGKGEHKTHTIDIPNYMGRVRVMVVASDGKAAGFAEKSVKVAKPLMILGTMPRQIGVGDKARISATVFANKAMGGVSVSIEAKNGVKVTGGSKKTLNFSSATDITVPFDIEAGEAEGEATIRLTCSGGGETAEYETKLKIRKEANTTAHTEKVTIKPGKEWAGKSRASLTGGTVERATVELTAIKPLNIASRVSEIIAYPHGCAEQTASKVFGQLYLNEFCDLTAEQSRNADQNIKAGIERLASYATADGGVAYWPGGSYADLWCSAYVYTLYTEAEAKGYYIQPAIKKALESYLRNKVRQWKNSDKSEAANVAQALFALANNNKAQTGVMNRLEEELAKPQAGWTGYAQTASDARNWLAAAYARAGNKQLAKTLISDLASNSGASLRLTAFSLAAADGAGLMADKVSADLSNSDKWMSTYSTSLAIMSWHYFAKGSKQGDGIKATLSVDGRKPEKISSAKFAWAKEIAGDGGHDIKIKNTGEGDLTVLLSTFEKAAQTAVNQNDNGLSVSVEGMPAGAVKAGETFDVRVVVTNTTPTKLKNVAVRFTLPAGFEIQAVRSKGVSHYDVRDDRVLAYADELSPGRSSCASFVAKVSATYAGDFYMPAADARLMYDDKVQGNSSSGRIVVE